MTEQRRLEPRVHQGERMDPVARFAEAMAHEFSNVLSGVLAYGEMLSDEAAAGSPLGRYAENVIAAATRGRDLIEQVLAFSRSRAGRRVPLDVARLVAESLASIRASLPPEIRLEASPPALPLMVIGDADLLHRMVVNLCRNAVQAMARGGTLRVAIESADVPAGRALSHGAIGAGRHIRLTVADSGCGMDATTLARMLEPFFTTRGVGQGIGLGLSVVDAIVADSGGAIDVASVLERGSTFTVFLPLAEAGDAFQA
jgi:signal transduction histidine kinase